MAALVSEPGAGGEGNGVGSGGLNDLLGKWLNIGQPGGGSGAVSAPTYAAWEAGTYTPPAPVGSVMPDYKIIGGSSGPNIERDIVIGALLLGGLFIVTKLPRL